MKTKKIHTALLPGPAAGFQWRAYAGHPALWLFAGAILLSLLVLVDYCGSPFFGETSWDAEVYLDWAKTIAAGDVIGSKVFHQAPLYPYFLALLLKLLGDGPVAIYLVQILLNAVTAALVFLIGERLHSRKAGLIAGLVFVGYGMFSFYTLKILSETLSVFLHVLLVFCLVRPRSRNSLLAAGVTLGLLILCRPNAVLFLPFALAYVLLPQSHLPSPTQVSSCRGDAVRRSWAGSRMAVLYVAVPAILLVSMATLRNGLVGRDAVLVSSNGGENFYVGNHAGASGVFVHVEGMGSVRGQGRDLVAEAAQRAGRELKPSEASRYWFRQGLSFIRSQPGQYALLLGRKLRYFVSGREHSNMYYLDFERRLFTPSLRIPFVTFYLVIPFALAGMVVSARQWRRHFLLYAMIVFHLLSIVLFFYDERFRLPMLPFAILFAAFGAVHLYETVGRFRTCVHKHGAVSAPTPAPSQEGNLPSRDGSGVGCEKAGTARGAGLRALLTWPVVAFVLGTAGMGLIYVLDQREPEFVNSHLYTAVGDAYYKAKQFDKANEAYQTAHQLNPQFPLPVFSMIKVAFARGKKDVAGELYEKYFPELGEHFGKVILDDPDFDELRAYLRSHKGEKVR